MKLICYGVRPVEKPIFEKANQAYNYELTLVQELLNDSNIELAKNHDAVMLRANCPANKTNLEILKSYGINLVITRTVGYNHIDLVVAKKLGIKTAYVPFYSPNAIAELAVSLTLMQLRHTAYICDNSGRKDFRIDEYMFSKEIRNCTVGVIGLGKIGFTVAQLFKGLQANVIGYDIMKKEGVEDVLKQVDLDTLLKESDIISIHCPYIPNSNYHLINKDTISKMKKDVILVNTARGELVDLDAVSNALENNQIGAFATDVIENETVVFMKDLTNQPINDEAVAKLVSMYPKALFTPHIGSYTDEAVKNMVETSYQNLKEFIENGESKNQLS